MCFVGLSHISVDVCVCGALKNENGRNRRRRRQKQKRRHGERSKAASRELHTSSVHAEECRGTEGEAEWVGGYIYTYGVLKGRHLAHSVFIREVAVPSSETRRTWKSKDGHTTTKSEDWTTSS